jgi:hypothetical protein
MKQQLNEVRRMQKIAGILNEAQNSIDEDMATGYNQSLNVKKTKSEDGNIQIVLSVLGGGWEENELVLSVPEAQALVKIGEKFLRERKHVSQGVNTPGQEGKYGAQSTIQIDPDGLKCVIGRTEDFGGSSSYRGYDEKSGSSTGRLRANQSIVYQIVEDLPSKI